MKNVMLGGVALITLGFVGAAVAADMPVKAPPPVVVNTWTGYYIGGDVGGANWKSSTESFTQTADPGLNPFGIVYDPVTNGSLGNWGAAGGVHAGYNWQLTPSWLVGVEGDWDKTNVGLNANQVNLTNGGLPIPPCFGPAPAGTLCRGLLISQNLNWTASVRGRLGFVWGSALFYGTGGVAWDSEERSGQVTTSIGNTSSIATSYNTVNSGWVGGGGVELMATANWLLRVEYLHYQFSGANTSTVACTLCAFGPLAGPGNFTWGGTKLDVLRAGLSYKF
jgi:outer membrane immunogenic protein